MKLSIAIILLCFVFACRNAEVPEVEFPAGGYFYPTAVDKRYEDLFCYPLKDSLSPRQSLYDSYFGHHFLAAFDEPNLSLKSQPAAVIRLVYFSVFDQPVVISLMGTQIIVKRGIKGEIYPELDQDRLTEGEKDDFRILENEFPRVDRNTDPKFRPLIDSLLKLYPQFSDPNFGKALLTKQSLPIKNKFSYTTHRIRITKEKFIELISLINNSEYWTMPYYPTCVDPDTDVGGFHLEANTKKKYNIVFALDCLTDSSQFRNACRELLKAAKISDRHI